MNNTISSVNNVNFQAKLNVAEVAGNKTRWKNIAKIFEQKTKQYPNDTLMLVGCMNRGVDVYLVDKKAEIDTEALIEPKLLKRLLTLSDNEVAGYLLPILKVLKNNLKVDALAIKMDKKLNLGQEAYSENTIDDYYAAFNNIKNDKARDILKGYPILQEGFLV